MKRFFYFFTLLAGLLFAAGACTDGDATVSASSVKGGRVWQAQESLSATDTASTTTNMAFSNPLDLRGQPNVSIRFGATNVSGTTGGTVYLQQTNDLSQVRWTNLDTLAYTDGTSTIFTVTDFSGYNLRLSAVNDATTQSTTFNADWVISNPNRE